MYCGSCLRDNVLAAALLDAGHQVVLIPTYTPTRPEGRDVSHDRVYMGGINVFLQEHVPFFRRTPRFVNRMLDAAPLLRLATRRGVSVDPHQLGRLTVSMLRGADGAQHRTVLELIRFIADDLSPEIVSIPNSLLIALAPAIKRELNVPVVCTLQGEDGFLDDLGEPYPRRGAAADSAARHGGGRVRRGQRVRRAADVGVSRDRLAPRPRRAGRHRLRRPRAGRPRQRAVHDRLPGADRAREGTARAVRGVPAPAGDARASAEPTGGRRLPGPGASRVPRRDPEADGVVGAGGAPGLRRRARPRRQAGLPADPQRALGPLAPTHPEGTVPPGSDGQRRPGRAAPAGRVHRGGGEHGRRHPDRRRRHRRARARPSSRCRRTSSGEGGLAPRATRACARATESRRWSRG